MGLAALLASLVGCAPKKPATVADLHFPVVVLHRGSSTVLYRTAADLNAMHVNHLVLGTDGPAVLIDSEFVIFIHGKPAFYSRRPLVDDPSTFELKRDKESGADAARRLLLQRLNDKGPGEETEQRRKAVVAQKTLVGMVAAFQVSSEEPEKPN